MMAPTIDRPTADEWVVTDTAAATHYYAKAWAVHRNGVQSTQLTITELGPYHGKYVFEAEVYSTFFFAQRPLDFANSIVHLFAQCQVRNEPVELVYAFGGTLAHPLPAFATMGGLQ